MRAESRPRRSKRRPEALASRQHAILALDHCGPTDKPLEYLEIDHRSRSVRNALSVMTGEVGHAAWPRSESRSCHATCHRRGKHYSGKALKERKVLGKRSRCDEADQWLLLKSAMPIRMIAGVPTVPQPPHATTAFVSDTASAHAP